MMRGNSDRNGGSVMPARRTSSPPSMQAANFSQPLQFKGSLLTLLTSKSIATSRTSNTSSSSTCFCLPRGDVEEKGEGDKGGRDRRRRDFLGEANGN